MARLGHNHVIRSRDLAGDILIGDQGEEPRVSLVLAVASFSVDDTALRAEEGEDFTGAVDEEMNSTVWATGRVPGFMARLVVWLYGASGKYTLPKRFLRLHAAPGYPAAC
jgi:hypothetical protein